MSTRITCDGCGKHVGTRTEPNYWQSTLMGDLLIGSDGRVLDATGVQDRAGMPMRKADMCTGCMSKTQEERTK